MKGIGVLGSMSPQATMDFEARVHRAAQRLVQRDWNRGYPRMVGWYHLQPPVRLGEDARSIVPLQLAPQLIEAAAWLGKAADFLVILGASDDADGETASCAPSRPGQVASAQLWAGLSRCAAMRYSQHCKASQCASYCGDGVSVRGSSVQREIARGLLHSPQC